MGAPQYEQAGADIGGTGTTNTIPRWTGPSTLGDSGLIDDGSVIYTTARNAAFGSTSSAGYRARVLAAAGTGSAFGVRIDAGTNSTDYALRIANQATTSDYFVVRGDGHVGIGTPAPVSYANYRTLAMAGAATGAIIDMGPGTNLQTSGGLQIATTATGTDINAQGPSGGAAAVLRFSAGTWGAVPARMLVSGSGTQAQSQVAIGTSSFTSGCSLTVAQSIDASQSAQGLKLPATPGNTDPNTLDCYADGGTANSGGVTWTPALRFGGATTGITGSQVGRYTRIGNMVFAQGTIALSSKGSATGAASIAGLPTSANVAATIYYSIAIGYNSKVTFTGQLHGLISVNSGIVELYQTSTAGVVSAITNTDFAADSVLTFTVCYPVT